MKTIVDKDTNISLYLVTNDKIIKQSSSLIEIGEPTETVITDKNIDNIIIYENVTEPADWFAGKYIFDGTDWSLNADFQEPKGEAYGNLLDWEIPPLTEEKATAREAYWKDKRDNS